MELTGKIIAVLQERGGVSKAGNEWKIQEYVLETMEQYPRKMMFNVFGADRIAQFNIQMGETLTVSFDIDSREYNGRWYTDVRAWRIEPAGAAQQDYATGAVAGGAGYVGATAPVQTPGYNYTQSAGSYSAPTGAPMPSADDMSSPVEDDLPF